MNNPENKRLILRFVGWFFLFNAFLFWILGYGYLKNILLSPTLFENTVANYSTLSGKILVVCFGVVNYLSFMMLLAFIPAIFLFILVYFAPYKRLIWIIGIVIATISFMLLVINNYVYSLFKFHLNTTILGMIFNRQNYYVFDFSTYELKLVLFILTFCFFLEVCIAYFVWHKIILTERYQIGRTIALLWLGGFLFSYFTLMHSILQNNNLFSQQTTNLPFYTQLIAYLIPEKNAEDILYRYNEAHFFQPFYSNTRLNYPINSMRCTKPNKPLNVIMILVDSLRYDALQQKYMPNLTQFGKRNWQFNNHLSGGNSTQPGLFSLFYSIPSSYWTASLEQKIAPVFIKLLLEYGYLTHILWSSELYIPPFDKTIYSGITQLNLNGSPGNDIGAKDRYVSEQAIKFLENHHNQTPFFLNLFYDAPHGYCREQNFPTPYQPAMQECSRLHFMSNDTDRILYYNRYLNAVHFVDGELVKVLNSIEKQGYLDNSVIIITSDHGQEFNDNKQNYWEHASNFTRTQVQVPLIIHWPNKNPMTINYLTSSYDIVPTLLKRLYSCQNPISDYSIGQDLLTSEGRGAFIIAGSYSNMGLIEPDRLMTLRTSGDIDITNLHAEPTPKAEPRINNLKKALELMRMYFVKNP